MGRMNPSGSATFSAKADEDLLEAFDRWVNDGDRFESRSEAIRNLMRGAVETDPEYKTPLEPPQDDALDHGYKRLVDAANRHGTIRNETAKRVCTNGPRNLSKKEVESLILRPLQRRGYIYPLSDVYGNTSWRLRGWDE